MAIQYIGGRGAGRAGSTSTVNVAINSGLTGGIGAAAIAGDLVVVTICVGTAARQPALTPTGYTPLTAQRTTATTYDVNVQTSYKFMPETPDTQVVIPSTGNIADGQGYRIMVFRGVDPTVPLDGVTPTYATGSGVNNRPDGAAITPATAGAWIIVGGGGAAGTGTTLFTAAELSGFVSYNGADTNDGTVGMGYYSGWSSGSWNPAGWLGGSVNAANSWGCTTLALRPAAVPVELTNVGAIASAVAYGAHLISVGILAVGIASAMVFGIATVTPYNPPVEITAAGGIPTGEGYGTPNLASGLSPTGVASANAFGQAALAPGLSPTGLTSGEVFGTQDIGAALTTTSIATAEVHGTQVLAVILNPAGLASEEAFGSPGLSLDVTSAGGIATEEAFGQPAVGGEPISLTNVGGLASAETYGTVGLAVDLSPAGLASSEGMGQTALTLLLSPSSLESASVLGSPTFSLNLSQVGNIPSSNAFGLLIVGDTSAIPKAIITQQCAQAWAPFKFRKR